MSVTDVRKDPETLTMTLTARFAAGVEQVWQLWQDPRKLERWWGPPTYPATMVEHVRARLARQICAQNTSHNGYLPLIALSARWEMAFAESIVGTGEERSLAMQPSKLSEFMTAVRNSFEQAAREGEAPVLVTSAAIRP